jgi:hypothetical protein
MAVRSLASRVARAQGSDEPIRQPALATILAIHGRRAQLDLRDGKPPVAARVASHVTSPQLALAASRRQEALVTFVGGERSHGVVIGLLENESAPHEAAALPDGPELLEAVVDGKRVSIVAADELTLKCGRASITLRRNGRVVVRGSHVETDSEGVNRIKGATVKIN